MHWEHHLWCAIMARIRLITIAGAFIAPSMLAPHANAQLGSPDWYVDGDISSSGNGWENWSQAFKTLQEALDEAGSGDIIWVAAATNPYKPDASDESVSFVIPDQVIVHGGFDGTEGPSDYGERKIRENETILSGDLGGGNNSYHVVRRPWRQ